MLLSLVEWLMCLAVPLVELYFWPPPNQLTSLSVIVLLVAALIAILCFLTEDLGTALRLEDIDWIWRGFVNKSSWTGVIFLFCAVILPFISSVPAAEVIVQIFFSWTILFITHYFEHAEKVGWLRELYP